MTYPCLASSRFTFHVSRINPSCTGRKEEPAPAWNVQAEKHAREGGKG
jgi:hypothetical protein